MLFYYSRYTYVIAQKCYETDGIKNGIVLYDKEKNPYQLNPIYKRMGYDEVIKRLHKSLVNHLNETNDPFIKLQWKAGSELKYHYYDALTRE